MEQVRKKIHKCQLGFLDIVINLNKMADEITKDNKQVLKQKSFLKLVIMANKVLFDVWN